MRPSDGLPGEPQKAERLRQNAHEWDKGADGERMVAAALDALPPEYRVYHHVGLPGTKESIDHVVVGPSGIIAVNDTYIDGDLQHGSGTLWRGKVPIRRECENTRWEADVLSTALQQPVDAVLCCAEAVLPEPIVTLDRMSVSSLDALTPYIIGQPPKLAADEVAVISSIVAPWVRTTTTRGVVSVLTTPDVTTGSARPGALPRREVRTPRRTRSQVRQDNKTRRLTGFEEHDAPKSSTGVAVSAGFAIVVLVGMWALWSRLDDGSERAGAPTTTSVPAVTTPVTEAPTTTAEATTTTEAIVPLPPTVLFSCESAGEGWTATLAPTEFVQDQNGYNVWYSARLSPFTFWGLFKSGLRVPEPLGGLLADESFMVKMDRDQSIDADLAPITETFTAPPESC